MGRSPLVAACALGLLTLSACSGSADPSPAPPPTSSTVASPSPSPSPAAPVMPEAAKAHTKAGAKAFVEYFWRVVNYAEVTGDVTALDPLFEKGCKPCSAGAAGISAIYRDGGRVTGGAGIVNVRKVDLSYGGPFRFADVDLELKTAEQRIDYAGATKDETRPSTAVHDQFKLIAESDGPWRVADFEAVK